MINNLRLKLNKLRLETKIKAKTKNAGGEGR